MEMGIKERIQTIKYIEKAGYDRSILEKITKEKDVLEYIYSRNGECGFESPCFKKYKAEEEEAIHLQENPNVVEGIFCCKKCKSRRIITHSKQTRSGDEATTVFAQCSKCGKSWIAN